MRQHFRPFARFRPFAVGARRNLIPAWVADPDAWALRIEYRNPVALVASDDYSYTRADAVATRIDESGAIVTVPADVPRIDGARYEVHGEYYLTAKPWTETAKLNASDADVGDQFGASCAIYGDTALIGAHFDDDLGSRSGSVYVFNLIDGVWTETAKLNASDAAVEDQFGVSCAIYGDTALIGAHFDADLGGRSGSVYVFNLIDGVWTETAKLSASDAAVEDQFGASCAIYGDTALIGAYLDDDLDTNSGSVYVFNLIDGVWTETAKLNASDAAGGDYFGASCAIYGDTALIGAYLDNDSGSDAGSVYVFTANNAAIPGPFWLKSEPAATYYYLNPQAPANQTIDLPLGRYTAWCKGIGSLLISADTATITGDTSASEGVPAVFEVTSAGTIDVAPAIGLTLTQVHSGDTPLSPVLLTTTAETRAADAHDHAVVFGQDGFALELEYELFKPAIEYASTEMRFFGADDSRGIDYQWRTVGDASAWGLTLYPEGGGYIQINQSELPQSGKIAFSVIDRGGTLDAAIYVNDQPVYSTTDTPGFFNPPDSNTVQIGRWRASVLAARIKDTFRFVPYGDIS